MSDAISFGDKPMEEVKGVEYVRPGTIDIFKMVDCKYDLSKEKQTPYLEFVFRTQDKQEFKHSFFLSQAALPRLVHLGLQSGLSKEVFQGDLSKERLIELFLNRKVGLRVSGSVSTNGKGYPTLEYANFAFSIDKIEDQKKIEFTKAQIDKIDAANNAIALGASTVANSNSNSASPVSQASPLPADDDDF